MRKPLGRALIIAENQLQRTLMEAIEGDFEPLFTSQPLQGYLFAKDEQPDLVLIQARQAGLDVVDFCVLLRKNESTRSMPLVLIGERIDSNLTIRAFEAGADDVVSIPFDPREFRARLVRRTSRSVVSREGTRKLIRRGNLELDEESYDCRVGGESVHLSVLEFNLLRFFLENFGRVLSREDILREVWRESGVSHRTIDTHIAGLRKKIAGSNLVFLALYGVGYSLREAPDTLPEQSAS